jgi:hypothetical protein
MQNGNNLGATPSIVKIFGWFIRLQTMTSLQNFYIKKEHGSTLDRPTSRETSHLVNLFDRIFLVHTKRFNRKHLIVVVPIGELPNIGGSSSCEMSFAELGERE